MKSIDSIPTSKINRASKILQTGVKVGVNYAKYYGDRITKTKEEAQSNLDESNATDIYDGLKELKGSALKVAQMLSMEQSILPEAYVDKFSLAQFSVPALSLPLVNKTFKNSLNKSPLDIFDSFSTKAIHAASIGQVHKATKGGKTLAVKIQYPGVAESISSDLALIKPFALKMFNIEKKGSEKYFKEVEGKLIEETDYVLELENSQEITRKCSVLDSVIFPKYYKEYSSDRIITMDWMNGIHLSEFTKQNNSEEIKNSLGQSLWDLFMFQIHRLRKVHADPHPGNFLVSKENKLVAIDFGCVKEIPDEFYEPYFLLAERSNLHNKEVFEEKMYELEVLKTTDSEKDKEFIINLFKQLLELFIEPFNNEFFDFSNDEYYNKIVELGQTYANDPMMKKINANRGSKHFIYINRVFFGLYSLMNSIGANKIEINRYKNFS